MNYCISGKSGFIGQAISKYLIDKGDTVYEIPRGLSIDYLFQWFRITKPDFIIHLATYGNHYDTQKDFRQMVDTNILGTYNLLEAAKTTNYKLFYNFTATSISGDLYYTTKHCAEIMAVKYKRVVNVKPYSVYGPGESKEKFIPRVIECLNSGENMIIDEAASHAWLYIDDLVRALFEGETELGGSSKITNQEIVLMLEQISGKKLNYIPGKVRNYDNDNWQAPKGVCYTSLHEGLKRTYEHYK
jgi:nucleoside-diphosphate-sugar epimerase